MRPTTIACALGLLGLLAAWCLASAPLSSPDEQAHLIRAVSAADGEFLGTKPSVPAGTQLSIAVLNTRVFTVAKRFRINDQPPCFAFNAGLTPACKPTYSATTGPVATHVGTYYPLLYVPLGLAARASPSVDAALYAARAVAGLTCALMLLAAYAASNTAIQRLGWLCAAGPLTFFVASTPSTNGIEVCASIAFVATGLALNEGGRSRTVAWTAAGILLVSAKALGPVFAGADIATVALFQAGNLRHMLARRASAAAIALAALANLAWSVLVTSSGKGLVPAGPALKAAWSQVEGGYANFFDFFGWQEVPLPPDLRLVGPLVLGVLALAGLVLARDLRGRAALLLVSLAAFVATVVVSYTEVRGGFGFQARYTLALVAVVPLIACANLSRRAPLLRGGRAGRIATGSFVRAAALGFIVFELVAVGVDARRYAVGLLGPKLFFRHPTWSPPGGWSVPIILALIGGIALTYATTGPTHRKTQTIP